MAADRVAGLRRLLAGFGSKLAVRELQHPFRATVRSAPASTVDVHAFGLMRSQTATAHAVLASIRRRVPTRRGLAVPPAAHRTSTLGADATAHRSAVGVDPVVARRFHGMLERPGGARGVRMVPRDASPQSSAAVIAAVPSRVVRVRHSVDPRRDRRFSAVWRMRRSPLGWGDIRRERLGAAWEAVLATSDEDAGQLELVGLYGPVPLTALTGVAVDDARRAHLSFEASSSGAAHGVVGDLAVARRRVDGRLVSAAIPVDSAREMPRLGRRR